MAPAQYDDELSFLGDTYRTALTLDISHLKAAIAEASESSIIAVGSGGSFTTASLFCSLHEFYTSKISRPSTPLEVICTPNLAASSPVFLISAEGKNPDIIEALQRARAHSARPVHVLTNRAESPLLDSARRLSDVGTHVFALSRKDGYLATNSLLCDAVLVARAYSELDRGPSRLPSALHELALRDRSIDTWLREEAPRISDLASRPGVIVVFSPLLRAVAADLESKLSESALHHCQLADLRSFAHGRHLWLARRPADVGIIALIEPSLSDLWEKMRSLLPSEVPTVTMPLGGATPEHLLSGLVAEMRLVSALAAHASLDPGCPEVPQFGRDLHYVELSRHVPQPRPSADPAVRSKYEVLGARWPSLERQSHVRRAFTSFEGALSQQAFRAIVFDYDGTLCSSHRHDAPPPPEIVEHLKRLANEGIKVGVASGRGTSIQEHLQHAIPEPLWPHVHLGLYNAGFTGALGDQVPDGRATSEFLSHASRIVGRLKVVGVPIERIRTTHPFQVSVRFRDGARTEETWFVIADAIRQAGLDVSRVVRSKHSVDILGSGINKSHLIAHIVQSFRIDPYEVLTVGDLGAWPGNDYSLLEHRFSLSVDEPSRRLDRGWKLAPAHKRDVDATLWYLERFHVSEGAFRVDFSSPHARVSP
jgi:HAD superfamily hydrolase (TIGR01484 family)